jgi:hypothetical protein
VAVTPRLQATRKPGLQATLQLGVQATRKPGLQATRKLGLQATRKPGLQATRKRSGRLQRPQPPTAHPLLPLQQAGPLLRAATVTGTRLHPARTEEARTGGSALQSSAAHEKGTPALKGTAPNTADLVSFAHCARSEAKGSVLHQGHRVDRYRSTPHKAGVPPYTWWAGCRVEDVVCM